MQYNKGSAALPAILALAGILATLTVIVSSITFLQTESTASDANSLESFIIGEAGVEDGAMRLARVKSFSSMGYTVTLGNGSAIVKSEQNIPGPGEVRMTSEATVKNSSRKPIVTFSISNYGKLTSWSWSEE